MRNVNSDEKGKIVKTTLEESEDSLGKAQCPLFDSLAAESNV